VNISPRTAAQIAILAARIIGGTSLLAFGAFLYSGPVRFFNLSESGSGALLIDFGLCMVFFIQHSGMVRKPFQNRLGVFVPSYFNGAIYTIVSGLTLFVLMALWQPAGVLLFSVGSPYCWILRAFFVASILGFVWGIRSLKSFDGFGVRPITVHLSGKTLREMPIGMRGPYKWVRHPLYFFFLVMLWSYPYLTTDRLLFNTMFTIWIFIGAILEERDLVSVFGAEYRQYQKLVPMLIPVRIPSQTLQSRDLRA
jgi:protein-S-isoprenylcysteine O-methyltransferase Ste14